MSRICSSDFVSVSHLFDWWLTPPFQGTRAETERQIWGRRFFEWDCGFYFYFPVVISRDCYFAHLWVWAVVWEDEDEGYIRGVLWSPVFPVRPIFEEHGLCLPQTLSAGGETLPLFVSKKVETWLGEKQGHTWSYLQRLVNILSFSINWEETSTWSEFLEDLLED